MISPHNENHTFWEAVSQSRWGKYLLDLEFDVLRDMGADYGQGYLLARPEVAPDPNT